jgi:hypothetical protein
MAHGLLEIEFLEPADAARITGLTPAGINAAADQGRLPIAARTRRGTRLYRLADVEAFGARRSAPASEPPEERAGRKRA